MKKTNDTSMKTGIITITKGAVYFMGLAVFSVNTILLPELAREEAAGRANPPVTYPFFIGAWVLSLPIFIALSQMLKLLHYMKENTAFSTQSVNALQVIKMCAVTFGILVALSAITIVVVARIVDPSEDTPPILLMGTIVAATAGIIATFIAVLQKLLKEAIAMKSENDLTV